MFDKLVEQKIREAMAAGEFDNLETAGQPINLEAYFSTPEDLRAGYAVLKNAGVLPEGASLRGEIAELRRELDGCADEAERSRLTRELATKVLKYRLLVEYQQGRRRAD